MPYGLIQTVGTDIQPLRFSLATKSPGFFALVCTSGSREIAAQLQVEFDPHHTSSRRWEIEDNPFDMPRLIRCCDEALQWLVSTCAVPRQEIFANLTSGRKWMSAAITIQATLRGIPLLYVDAKYLDGVLIPEPMRLVDLGSPLDKAGFIEYERARTAFNAYGYQQAAEILHSLNPAGSDDADLYDGLAGIAECLLRWDRFEHLGNPLSAEFQNATRKARRGAGHRYPHLHRFCDELGALFRNVDQVSANPRSSLTTFDLLANADRRLQRGDCQDAVARAYRALEAVAQRVLADRFGIDASAPTYGSLDDQSRNQLDAFWRQQYGSDFATSRELGLRRAWAALKWLDDVAVRPFFDAKNSTFKFEGLLKVRNRSILAHGWTPVKRDTAKKFVEQVRECAEALLEPPASGTFSVPELPPI